MTRSQTTQSQTTQSQTTQSQTTQSQTTQSQTTQSQTTLCARVIIEELIGRGVREFVLAPGSRSAPLAYELYDADKIGLVRLHVRIDERSAGFLALGLAKASGAPVAVVTTSGTAVANLHPAILEASHGGIPLVAITADRPGSMINTGANQTTDQARMFERQVRADAHLDAGSGAINSWRFQVARLLAAATGVRNQQPGPVQLNVAFDAPLTPQVVDVPPHPDMTFESIAPNAEPVVLAARPQTVIVAGDASPALGAEARRLAATGRIPLFAEPSSNARGAAEAISAYRLLLGSPLAEEIERVIMIGHPTLSRPVLGLLARDDIELIVVSAGVDWIDPGLNASRILGKVDLEPAEPGTAGEWLSRWLAADQQVRTGLTGLQDASTELTGPAVAWALWQRLAGDDVLIVGSSNPIRDLDLAPPTSDAPTVYANRGLAGIDGTVSTAIGIALAAERPSHALLGDLTFLHDSNGLIIGPEEPRPDLRIVVANDNGGSIFATLEQGQPAHAGAFERIFGTPHGVDLEALAASVKLAYSRVTDLEALNVALKPAPHGLEIVEAVIDRRHRRTWDSETKSLCQGKSPLDSP